MTKNGIDVSYAQENIDWSRVKTDFCIIQAGYGRISSQKDKFFERNYSGCKSHNIPCGAYWYSYATTVEDAKKEAYACLEVIKGKQFEYPVYFDLEEPSALATGKANCSAMVRAFCNILESAGYWTGLYMSASHLNTYIEDDIKSRYSIWVAHYGVPKPSYNGTYGMWQSSATGRIAGINKDVDIDSAYIDYPSEIKKAGLNGFPKQSAENSVTAKKSKKFEITVDGVTYSGTLSEKT